VTSPAPAHPSDAAEPPALVVDARGRRCPLPVIELARRIGEIPLGAVIAVLADDPAAAYDIPAWCRLRGQASLGASDTPGGQVHLVRRVS
jgi:TusA-related sulfurtransferase